MCNANLTKNGLKSSLVIKDQLPNGKLAVIRGHGGGAASFSLENTDADEYYRIQIDYNGELVYYYKTKTGVLKAIVLVKSSQLV